MKKLALILPLFLLAVFVMPAVVGAQAPTSGLGPQLVNTDVLGTTGSVSGTSQLVDLILGLVNWVAWFLSLGAVVVALISGYLFITAGGDPAKIETAKGALLLSIIVVIIGILSFSIVSIAKSIAGL